MEEQIRDESRGGRREVILVVSHILGVVYGLMALWLMYLTSEAVSSVAHSDSGNWMKVVELGVVTFFMTFAALGLLLKQGFGFIILASAALLIEFPIGTGVGLVTLAVILTPEGRQIFTTPPSPRDQTQPRLDEDQPQRDQTQPKRDQTQPAGGKGGLTLALVRIMGLLYGLLAFVMVVGIVSEWSSIPSRGAEGWMMLAALGGLTLLLVLGADGLLYQRRIGCVILASVALLIEFPMGTGIGAITLALVLSKDGRRSFASKPAQDQDQGVTDPTAEV